MNLRSFRVKPVLSAVLINFYITSSVASSIAQEQFIANYPVKFEEVVQGALAVSEDIAALKKELLSSTDLLDSEEGYYYPKATLATDLKRFYGDPVPAAETTGEASLSVNMKLYGQKVSERIDAASKAFDASEYSLKNETLQTYYTVLRALTKIERTRYYNYQADLLKKELEFFMARQENATQSGISTESDLKEVKLNYAKFNKAVYGIVSNIDGYFKELAQKTGYQIRDQESVGVNYKRLSQLLESTQSSVLDDGTEFVNYELLAQKSTLEASRLSAEAQRERYRVGFTAENYVNILDNGTTSFGQLQNKSFVGIRLDVDMYDFQKEKAQSSAFNLYYADKHRFEKKKLEVLSKIRTLDNQYHTLLSKREFTLEQIRLTRELIESQKKEIYTDRVTYLDIVKILLTHNEAFIALSNLDQQIFDTIYDLRLLQSEKVL